jgi:ribonuclease R
LASDCYCHFTSPIRRYPDLTVHRALDSLARGRRPPADGLQQLGDQCSQLERRAESAERELVKLKLLHFLSSRIGLEMDAVVTGVESFGLFVQGLELPAEGLVALDSLPGDTYRYERTSHTLTGRRQGNSFRLGDRVRVTVAKVDLERRTLDFRLVESHGRRPRQPAPRRPGSKPRGHGSKPHGQGGRSRASGPGAAKRSQRSGRKQKRQR